MHPSPQDHGVGLPDLIKTDFDHVFRTLFRTLSPERDDEVLRVVTRIPHPFGNMGLVNQVSTPELTSAAIDGLVDDAFPSAFMSTETVPDDSARILEAAGFVLTESMPLMALDLERLQVPEPPLGCTLERADAAAHDAWVEAMSTGYELPRAIVEPMGPGVLDGDQDGLHVEFHLARHEGRPVASSMHTRREGTIGNYCIATDPEYRGRGLGGWVTAAPLHAFREAGYRTAVLQSSEMGASIYRRLGFEEYGTIPLYVRIPG